MQEACLAPVVAAYVEGRMTRRQLFDKVARFVGGGAALVLVPVIETHAATGSGAQEVLMLSLREMSDRLEIQKNLWDYAMAVDMKDFDALDQVFMPGARLDYGRGPMTYPEAKAWLKNALGRTEIRGYYHLMGHMRIELRGDSAESLTACYNPMEYVQGDGRISLWLNGLFYHWRHARTSDGWRIAERLPTPPSVRGYRYSLPPIDPAGERPMIR